MSRSPGGRALCLADGSAGGKGKAGARAAAAGRDGTRVGDAVQAGGCIAGRCGGRVDCGAAGNSG
ncbi:hypothetical protein A6M21_03250 [Desulfotomaculum copahuensis]|uniref:Uncharacterized protein n=1 Tax=Desulfotomaculum copahuensis TaxID=1838280 RepID=A0A1B7LIS1_9FIRM|nr:hypothetical protein A6M21_03250 [Desulfotomaculum copahuensis]